MSAPPKVVSFVQSVLHGFPGKCVLLVEGPNDKAVYSAWLEKLAYPDLFSAKVVVEAVGGKLATLAALEWFRDHGGNPGHLFGLVDRDEWDGTTIAAQTAALPQLRVVAGRECLESYFVDPENSNRVCRRRIRRTPGNSILFEHISRQPYQRGWLTGRCSRLPSVSKRG